MEMWLTLIIIMPDWKPFIFLKPEMFEGGLSPQFPVVFMCLGVVFLQFLSAQKLEECFNVPCDVFCTRYAKFLMGSHK
jgi:hypothetical protein